MWILQEDAVVIQHGKSLQSIPSRKRCARKRCEARERLEKSKKDYSKAVVAHLGNGKSETQGGYCTVAPGVF